MGEDGKSAYDLWLELGNTGTEEEFLESLKGSDGTSVNILGKFDTTDELPTDDLANGDSYLINGELWVYTGSTEDTAVNGFINAGNIQGPAGEEGFNPTITPNPNNTDKDYRLDITTKDGTFTTPNLRGGDEVTKYTYTADGPGVTTYYSYVDLSTKVGETVSVTVSNKYGMYEMELTVINIISDTELTVDTGGGEITIVLTNVETTTAELIDDNITATTSTWSSQRIANELEQVFDNLTPEQIESLKGEEGFNPIITENEDNTDDVYKLDIETKDGKFTTPNLKGKDGEGSKSYAHSVKVIGTVGSNYYSTVIDYDEIREVYETDNPINLYGGWTLDKVESDDDSMEAFSKIAICLDKQITATPDYISVYDLFSIQHEPGASVEPGSEYTVTYEWNDSVIDDDTTDSDTTWSSEKIARDYSSKEYVAEQISNSLHLVKEIVDEIPAVEDAKENVIYMIKDDAVTSGDVYKEYQLINGAVVQTGDTSIDLTDYVKKEDIPNLDDVAIVNDNDISLDSTWSSEKTVEEMLKSYDRYVRIKGVSGGRNDYSIEITELDKAYKNPPYDLGYDWQITEVKTSGGLLPSEILTELFAEIDDYCSDLISVGGTSSSFRYSMVHFNTGSGNTPFEVIFAGNLTKPVVVDEELDIESTNAIQNKVVAEKFIEISAIELSQAEYDTLSDDEKMNGKEYHTYDTGHIYKLGVEYGKDAELPILHHRLVVQDTAGYVKIKAPTRDDEFKITVSDNYGGSIEITGMIASNSEYKPFKVVRTSNGNWYSHDASDTTNNKIQKVYYYDGYLYILLVTYTTAIITGVTEIPTVVETLENTDTEIPIISFATTENYNMKTYTNVTQLGLSGGCSVIDIYKAMPANSQLIYGSYGDANHAGGYAVDIPAQHGLLEIKKSDYDGCRATITFTESATNSMGYKKKLIAEFASSPTGLTPDKIKWHEVAYKDEVGTITTLEELGLTSSATVDDVHNKLAVGQIAILSVQAFDNYQTLFPYADSNDQYARLEIQKGESVAHSRIFWWRKDGSRFAIGNINSNNKLGGWHEYALKNYVDSKVVTPVIKAAAGSNINTVGTPSVTASTSGNETTFTFNNLKGATGGKGDTGTRGSQWYSGVGITGTSTTAAVFSTSGVSSALVGDMYLNTTFQNVYRCTTAGNASTAKWVYVCCIQGAPGASGTTPTIKASAGSNISSIGTPSVSASTSGSTTTFTFNNLKGEKGATGATPMTHVNGMGGGERTMAELGANEGIIAICTNVSGGSFFTSVTDGTVKCNGSAFTSSKQPTAGTSYVIVNSGSSTARIYCKSNGGSAWTIIGDVI